MLILNGYQRRYHDNRQKTNGNHADHSGFAISARAVAAVVATATSMVKFTSKGRSRAIAAFQANRPRPGTSQMASMGIAAPIAMLAEAAASASNCGEIPGKMCDKKDSGFWSRRGLGRFRCERRYRLVRGCCGRSGKSWGSGRSPGPKTIWRQQAGRDTRSERWEGSEEGLQGWKTLVWGSPGPGQGTSLRLNRRRVRAALRGLGRRSGRRSERGSILNIPQSRPSRGRPKNALKLPKTSAGLALLTLIRGCSILLNRRSSSRSSTPVPGA